VSDGIINSKSFDFVTQVSLIFGVYEKSLINAASTGLGNQLLDTLTELIQGPCRDNQRALIGAKVIDNCRDLISSF